MGDMKMTKLITRENTDLHSSNIQGEMHRELSRGTTSEVWVEMEIFQWVRGLALQAEGTEFKPLVPK